MENNKKFNAEKEINLRRINMELNDIIYIIKNLREKVKELAK